MFDSVPVVGENGKGTTIWGDDKGTSSSSILEALGAELVSYQDICLSVKLTLVQFVSIVLKLVHIGFCTIINFHIVVICKPIVIGKVYWSVYVHDH